jgi:hypothetical protein
VITENHSGLFFNVEEEVGIDDDYCWGCLTKSWSVPGFQNRDLSLDFILSYADPTFDAGSVIGRYGRDTLNTNSDT